MAKTIRFYRFSHWIAELLTLANAVCGLFGGFFLVKFVIARSISAVPPLGNLTLVWIFMLFGGIFDYLDGAVSRCMGISTELGKELDSQCDGVTFGVIPAMIILLLNISGGPLYWSIFVWLGAAAYLGCALFRLARFDVGTLPGKEYHLKFKGMPTPLAAGMIGAAVMLYISLHDGGILFVKMLWDVFSRSAVIQFSDYLIMSLPFLGFLLALCMISNMECIHFEPLVQFLKHRKFFEYFLWLALALPLVIILREMILLLLPLSFALQALVMCFYRKVIIRKG